MLARSTWHAVKPDSASFSSRSIFLCGHRLKLQPKTPRVLWNCQDPCTLRPKSTYKLHILYSIFSRVASSSFHPGVGLLTCSSWKSLARTTTYCSLQGIMVTDPTYVRTVHSIQILKSSPDGHRRHRRASFERLDSLHTFRVCLFAADHQGTPVVANQ